MVCGTVSVCNPSACSEHVPFFFEPSDGEGFEGMIDSSFCEFRWLSLAIYFWVTTLPSLCHTAYEIAITYSDIQCHSVTWDDRRRRCLCKCGGPFLSPPDLCINDYSGRCPSLEDCPLFYRLFNDCTLKIAISMDARGLRCLASRFLYAIIIYHYQILHLPLRKF